MLRLHYAPRTISIAVAITLEEVGTPYEAVLVDFKAGAQTKPDYRALNPKGRVPTLETPDGVLTETAALLEYVAPSLVPADPFAAAKMRELMCYLNGTMHPYHAHGLRGERWADQQASFADMKQKVPETMGAAAAYLETCLPDLPFDAGAGQVASDPYLYVVLSWLKGDGVEIADFPNLAAFQSRMAARASVQAVHAKGMI
ncbi:glutathione S-transferase family protein [Yoonia sediminilitoris]|uniref:Glutathione S-transferase n=1 Tax=Yoonia sediminilitoris TaxID=1286148 RepID=A0A2T6KN09_9RHOB|nr:glutathione S-transferase family protein [Yoonia sediminilitoris]PUB17610.1 glutathione S-transferase [Yoonia sediminilitoris]RCW97905.1 glutathione S-transferase [Yoonia sediminilitoris]